jgi:hypothetical protein
VFDRSRYDRRNFPEVWDNTRRVDVVARLKQLVGLHGDEYGAHFFLREALRFITRPNADLVRLTRALLNEDLKPVPGWTALSSCTTCRTGVHVRRGDKVKDWIVPSLGLYAEQIRMRVTTESSAGLQQLVVSSDEPSLYTELVHLLASRGNQNDLDRVARTRNKTQATAFIKPERFAVLTTLRRWHVAVAASSSSPGSEDAYDDGMLLMAQVFAFAACDMFFGVFSSNIGTTVHALMGALRFSALVPAYDVTGSPWAACSIFASSPFHPLKVVLGEGGDAKAMVGT